MKSAVETLGPTRAKMTVEVPFEELKASLDAAYQAIAKQVNIPGFRKGKVPPPVIDRQVGREAVLNEAVNEALPELYMTALRENELQPLGQPEIEITRLDDREQLDFTAEMDVRPSITLPSYSDLTVEVEDVEVTDSDVDEQIEELRARFGTLREVDRPAADGDAVTLDLKATTQDGEDIEGGELSGYSYTVGSGQLLEGIDEALVGKSKGEEATFTSTLLGGDLAGQEVDVHVTVQAVQERELPEVDEEFAQMASEFDTVEELRDDVRTRLEGAKRLEQAASARDAILEQLLDATEVPLPDAIFAEELSGRRQEIEEQLNYAGMTLQQYLDDQKQTVDEFEAELEKRVRDAMASQFLLDEIARVEEIGVEQQELSEHMVRRAQQSGQDPNQFVQHILEHNHVPEMVGEVVRGKALAQIVEGATVTDASGRPVDLKNLLPDGSIAPPEEAAEAAEGGAAAVPAGDAEAAPVGTVAEDTREA